MSDKIIFSKLTLQDIDGLMEVEVASFPTPWHKESFINEVSKNHLAHYVVGRDGDKIMSYMGMWIVLDEAHITNVAVLPDYRKKGIGTMMLRYMMKLAMVKGAVRMTLESRVSNNVAVKLYRDLGFINAGIRPKYYSDNGEDAMIMWKELKEEE